MPKLTLPTKRRTYHAIYAPVSGMKIDLPSTMIPEQNTPRCEEVRMREGVVDKSTGTSYFASTNTYPLSGSVMSLVQFNKLDGVTKILICHTDEEMYHYSTVTKRFVPLTNVLSNVVCRVNVYKIYDDAECICSVTVLNKSTKNLVCRVTKS